MRLTLGGILCTVFDDLVARHTVLHVYIGTPCRQLHRVETVHETIVSSSQECWLSILIYEGRLRLQRLWVTKPTLLLTIASPQAIGSSAAGVALACGNEVGQILLEVLNLGIGMVANVDQTKEVATAQPLAPYSFVCHTAAWPLCPWHFQQLTSHVGTAAWPLSPRQIQQLTSHAGKLSIAAAWTLAPRKFQQLTSRAGKLSTATVWTLAPR